jgi:hypothetical protein
MRIALICMFLATTIGLSPTSYGQGAKPEKKMEPSFSIVIRASQDVVKIGSPVSVEVTKTNQSNHEINNSKVRSFNGPYEIEIKDEQGNLRPETESSHESKKSKGADQNRTFSAVFGSLKPGESERDRIDVDRYYEIKIPGKYTIQLHQFDNETKMTVKSNTVTVTVTP